MYHGIVIDQQFEGLQVSDTFKIFAQKQDGDWGIYGIEVEDERIAEDIILIQKKTKLGTWYSHFYNDDELIVVFKNKVFRATPHKSTWKEIIKYGESLDIPESQLTFWPNRFQDEEHYFV